jgi:hypothetical protein
MEMVAWNAWYHIVAHVYGSWLRGDPRDWRSRHHREHVEGDYKNPPPKGMYDKLYEYSKSLMKRDAVHIELNLREFVLCAIIEKLRVDGIEVIIASLDGYHLHILARFPDHNPRYWIGWAKKYATQMLKAHGLAVGLNLKSGEGLWAKRCHPKPISSSYHHSKTIDYIADHAKRGAAVCRFQEDPLENINLELK